LFESVQSDDAAARVRSAAIAPLAAGLLYLLYLTVYPLFGRVPAALFWLMTAIQLAGAIGGAIAIIRVVRAHSMRGRAFAWLVGAVIVEVFCARTFLAMAVPWL
jgi:hypothetical protein